MIRQSCPSKETVKRVRSNVRSIGDCFEKYEKYIESKKRRKETIDGLNCLKLKI